MIPAPGERSKALDPPSPVATACASLRGGRAWAVAIPHGSGLLAGPAPRELDTEVPVRPWGPSSPQKAEIRE